MPSISEFVQEDKNFIQYFTNILRSAILNNENEPSLLVVIFQLLESTNEQQKTMDIIIGVLMKRCNAEKYITENSLAATKRFINAIHRSELTNITLLSILMNYVEKFEKLSEIKKYFLLKSLTQIAYSCTKEEAGIMTNGCYQLLISSVVLNDRNHRLNFNHIECILYIILQIIRKEPDNINIIIGPSPSRLNREFMKRIRHLEKTSQENIEPLTTAVNKNGTEQLRLALKTTKNIFNIIRLLLNNNTTARTPRFLSFNQKRENNSPPVSEVAPKKKQYNQNRNKKTPKQQKIAPKNHNKRGRKRRNNTNNNQSKKKRKM
eukprot:TRINITY_DN10353_c0_g1_i1.p1 TRINITY_DN10353_c0_g1~~TRINITY_DN10353_c0_g1_i1.p1  ORF type:complete len:320 (-),score=54.40 TRINITY_DN10353_c0_g1_i1:48-1007(-)